MRGRLINIKKSDKLVLKDTITKHGKIIITVEDDNLIRIELTYKKRPDLNLGIFHIVPRKKTELAIACTFLN